MDISELNIDELFAYFSMPQVVSCMQNGRRICMEVPNTIIGHDTRDVKLSCDKCGTTKIQKNNRGSFLDGVEFVFEFLNHQCSFKPQCEIEVEMK